MKKFESPKKQFIQELTTLDKELNDIFMRLESKYAKIAEAKAALDPDAEEALEELDDRLMQLREKDKELDTILMRLEDEALQADPVPQKELENILGRLANENKEVKAILMRLEQRGPAAEAGEVDGMVRWGIKAKEAWKAYASWLKDIGNHHAAPSNRVHFLQASQDISDDDDSLIYILEHCLLKVISEKRDNKQAIGARWLYCLSKDIKGVHSAIIEAMSIIVS